ncbi:MAG: protein kinase, partial [Planctomycetales bacterium]
MSVTLNEFIEGVERSGVLSVARIAQGLDAVPESERPTESGGLLDLLESKQLISRFQAETLRKGLSDALIFGEYVLIDKIGQGGMGMVFKARHRRMKRLAAIKMLPKEASESEHLIKRFYREVEAAAVLSHPNIVTAYDAGEAHGTHYLVMEYVPGKDL